MNTTEIIWNLSYCIGLFLILWGAVVELFSVEETTTPPNSKSSIDSTCGEDVVRTVSQHDGLHLSITVHVLKHDERVLDELRLVAVIVVGPPQFGDMKLT